MAHQVSRPNYYNIIPTAPPMIPPASLAPIQPTFSFGTPNSNTCLYCLREEGQLFVNNLCQCSYYFHRECFMKYVRLPRNFYFCPLCRVAFIIPSTAIYFSKIANTAAQLNRDLEAQREIETQAIVNRSRQYDNNRRCLILRACFFIVIIITAILYVAFTASLTSWRRG